MPDDTPATLLRFALELCNSIANRPIGSDGLTSYRLAARIEAWLDRPEPSPTAPPAVTIDPKPRRRHRG